MTRKKKLLQEQYGLSGSMNSSPSVPTTLKTFLPLGRKRHSLTPPAMTVSIAFSNLRPYRASSATSSLSACLSSSISSPVVLQEFGKRLLVHAVAELGDADPDPS